MRILHVIGSVDPTSGGPVEGVFQHALRCSSISYEVHIACLDDPSDWFIQMCPVQVFALGEARSLSPGWLRHLPWVRYGYAPKFVTWLLENMHNYDIVIVNGLWNYATFGARRALVGSGLPYAVFTHGMLDPWFKKTYPLKTILKQILWWYCEGPLLRHSRAVLFTAEEERILARNAFWPYHINEKVVGYGTSDLSGDPDTQRAAFQALLPQLGNRPYFLFLGRIHPKKGCDILIEAFAKIGDLHKEVDLIVAGPDQIGWRRDLETRASALGIASRMHWPGMLTGDAKWGAFRGAEALILPSHQENFGVVVAEAMAAGKPVLLSDKINIWREVVAAGAGLVETDDLEGVSRLFASYLALSPVEKAEMGRRARITFLEHFEIGKAVETLNLALKEAMA